MGFLFRRTVKILPGLKINISKSGVSTSFGGPGATVNVKRGRKTKTTIGAPGTGLSYSSYSSSSKDSEKTDWGGVAIIIAFFAFVILIAKSCS